jgi:DNA segregation ATPase FtsK/SpoIIIE-like protein
VSAPLAASSSAGEQPRRPRPRARPAQAAALQAALNFNQTGGAGTGLAPSAAILYLPPGTALPERVHGAFVSDEEVHRVVEFLKQHGGGADYVEGVLAEVQTLGDGTVVGASMGGNLAEEAFRVSKPGEIDRIVFLAHGAFGPPQALKVKKFFVVAKDDMGPGNVPRLNRIQIQYDQSPDPKELLVLDGDAHAQFLFETNQADRLLQAILKFLNN